MLARRRLKSTYLCRDVLEWIDSVVEEEITTHVFFCIFVVVVCRKHSCFRGSFELRDKIDVIFVSLKSPRD
jgi:hypothetical protein